MRIAAAFLAILVSVSGVSAATMQAVFTGKVTGQYGVDSLGLFGAPGSALTSGNASLTYTYDTQFGSRTTTGPDATGWDDNLWGGSWYGTVSPILNVLMTINGQSLSFVPSTEGFVETRNFAQYIYPSPTPTQVSKYEIGANGQMVLADGTLANISIFSVLEDAFLSIPARVDLPLSLTGLSVIQQTISSANVSNLWIGGWDSSGLFKGTTAQFSLDTLSVSQVGVAAVPVPSAFGLLLTGLGGIAAAKRRKRV